MNSKIFIGSLFAFNVLLLCTIIILGIKLNDLNGTVQKMTIKPLVTSNENYVSMAVFDQFKNDTESRLMAYASEPSSIMTEQSLEMNIRDLRRMAYLIDRIQSIDTLYGVITGMTKNEVITIQIHEYVLDESGPSIETENEINLELDSSCLPYFVDTLGLIEGTVEQFTEKVDMDLKDHFEDKYTFKVIDGKIVQIYQGTLE